MNPVDDARTRTVHGPMLGGMTIASHCLELLSLRSPRTLDELAEAGVAAGLIRSQNPRGSVTQALLSHQMEAPLLGDGRYGFTLHILEGCWLTTRQRNGDRLPPGFDTGRLTGLLRYRTLALATGGRVGSTKYADGLRGPAGWLPNDSDGTLIGLRITDGALEVRTVVLDDEAAVRGHDLARRLRARVSSRDWTYGPHGREHEVWDALVMLLAGEPDVLSSPVAPLSELLPDLARRPEAKVELADPVTMALPIELRDRLQKHADDGQLPLSIWLTEKLQELAYAGSWPRRCGCFDGWDYDRGYTQLYCSDEDRDLDSGRDLSAS